MKTLLHGAAFLLCSWLASAATLSVGPWAPLFQGIDFATGRQEALFSGERDQAVYALRVDLTDPTIRFFGMPRCTDCGSEVISTTPVQFLMEHGLQVAVNCNFFWPNSLTAGVPTDVLGLAISQGEIVSPLNDLAHPSALLFTTNNTPTFVATNIPSTNLAGIYTAVSGNHPIVLNGVNVADPVIDVDPRTAMGLSQDGRFFIALVIDGRQTNYSDGATYYETADWLLRFGAYQGMNVDGGSCSTLLMQDCAGAPVRLNRNSYVATHNGDERGVGHLIGFYARPASTFIHDVTVLPADSTATVLWRTDVEATTLVEFGLTTNYGRLSAFSSMPMTSHAMTLTGLASATTYHFRTLSTAGTNQQSWACRFTTLGPTTTELLFDLTQPWRYTTNNLDRTNWSSVSYDDSAWLGSGPGLLCVETNVMVSPRNTPLPPSSGSPIPPTYYFRTHFNFTGDTTGVSLLFSNYVDDGAVFYLNGSEIYRLRMRPAPAVITYTNLASGYACSNAAPPCGGEACASCPDVFMVPANLITNLHPGDNVLAVEVHNYTSGSLDLVFGSALFCRHPYVPPRELNVLRSDTVAALYWNGSGFTLQKTAQLGLATNWADVSGPVTASPFFITNLEGTQFFRLRK